MSDLVSVMFESSQHFMECHGLAVAHADTFIYYLVWFQ